MVLGDETMTTRKVGLAVQGADGAGPQTKICTVLALTALLMHVAPQARAQEVDQDAASRAREICVGNSADGSWKAEVKRRLESVAKTNEMIRTRMKLALDGSEASVPARPPVAWFERAGRGELQELLSTGVAEAALAPDFSAIEELLPAIDKDANRLEDSAACMKSAATLSADFVTLKSRLNAIPNPLRTEMFKTTSALDEYKLSAAMRKSVEPFVQNSTVSDDPTAAYQSFCRGTAGRTLVNSDVALTKIVHDMVQNLRHTMFEHLSNSYQVLSLELDSGSRICVAKVAPTPTSVAKNTADCDKTGNAPVLPQALEVKAIAEKLNPAAPLGANKYRTSTGAVFETVSRAGWAKAVKGPDGTIWSEYQGDFSNTGTDKDGIVTDSAATRACAKIGGTVPTKQDFEKLKASFELDGSGHLTDQGRKDLYTMFPDMKGRWFWSSSVHPNFSYYASYFSGLYGNVYYDVRSDADSVRCVAR
jgi:hypothetical protein